MCRAGYSVILAVLLGAQQAFCRAHEAGRQTAGRGHRQGEKAQAVGKAAIVRGVFADRQPIERLGKADRALQLRSQPPADRGPRS